MLTPLYMLRNVCLYNLSINNIISLLSGEISLSQKRPQGLKKTPGPQKDPRQYTNTRF